ncbi:MAG: PAS domain S-box protein, partial [Phycisphaerae bacterium]|nr:PAS domain S-box protein [Phycisphaerae bacterium]
MTLRVNIAARIVAIIEYFIPARVRTAGGVEYHRARLLVAFALAVIAAGCPYGLLYSWQGSADALMVIGLAFCAGLCLLLVLRRTGRIQMVARMSVGLLYASLTGLAFCLGGSLAPPLVWYAAVPLVSISLEGRRSAMVWAVVVVASLLAMVAAEQAGFAFQDDLAYDGHRLVQVIVVIGLTLLVLTLAELLEYYREQALTNLRREKMFSEHVVNSLPGVFYVFDDQGRFLSWNDNFRRVTGYTEAELTSMCPRDFFTGEDRGAIARAVQQVFETGECDTEAGLTSKDGRQTPYYLTGRLAVLDGRPCLVGMGVDVAERRRAEEALRLSEARFRTAASTVSDLIYEWDVATGRVEWFGDIDAALGFEPGGFPRTLQAWFGRVHREDQKRVANTIDRHRVETDPIFEEYRIECEDGQWRHWVDRGQPVLSADGKPRYWVGACVDVTDEKRVELELIAARRAAEAASQAKSEFLANMSHEIRTPMTAILGFTDLLTELDDLENVPSQYLEATRTIKRNGEHLLGIINDILDLSKIEAGRMTVERIRCSPCRIMAEAAELMRVRCDAKGLSIDIAYEGPMPETIESDPLRLRQILMNVLGNAVKFTEHGSVRLTGGFDHEGGSRKLHFDVTDSGIGMTSEQVERLFLPFTQADSSTTRRYGGTGLGLTISKRLAGMLDGDIRVVETGPGYGTRIRITVGAGDLKGVRFLTNPSSDSFVGPEDTRADAAGDEQPCQAWCILLAEDGPDN